MHAVSNDLENLEGHSPNAHTHTHTRLTAIFPGLTGWAGTRKAKPIWILLKQETVSGSGISWNICKSAPRSRQITMPAPHHSAFYRPDALPAAQPTASKHWRHKMSKMYAIKVEILWPSTSAEHTYHTTISPHIHMEKSRGWPGRWCHSRVAVGPGHIGRVACWQQYAVHCTGCCSPRSPGRHTAAAAASRQPDHCNTHHHHRHCRHRVACMMTDTAFPMRTLLASWFCEWQ